MDKVLLAYQNLNEALSNNKVNKKLILDLADGLESDLGLSYKVKPFQFSDELSEVGLLQAESISDFAKQNILELNYKNSKEVYENTKSIITNFNKFFKDIKNKYEINSELVDKVTNYYANQAINDYVVGSDGSLLESKNENKAVLILKGWHSNFLIEILNDTIEDNQNFLDNLKEISEIEDKYSPFLNLIANIIDSKTVEKTNDYSYISNSYRFGAVGKKLYGIDIVTAIVNDTLFKEIELLSTEVLNRFYGAYYGQETINELKDADKISTEKENLINEIDLVSKISNCFSDPDGIKVITFLIKIIYSKEKK